MQLRRIRRVRRVEQHRNVPVFADEQFVHNVTDRRLVVDEPDDLCTPAQFSDGRQLEIKVFHVEFGLEHDARFGRHNRESIVTQRLHHTEHHLLAITARQVHDVAATADQCLYKRGRAGRNFVVLLPVVREEPVEPELLEFCRFDGRW